MKSAKCTRGSLNHHQSPWFILIIVLLLLFMQSCKIPTVSEITTQTTQTAELSTPVVFTTTDTPFQPSTEEPTATATATPSPEEERVSRADIIANSKLPAFDQFIQDLKTGENRIVGLWVDNILALQVVYQPSSNPAFVSTEDDIVTFFLLPWEKAGNYGLLAHNYLAGRYFFNLQVGDIISLVWGNGDYEDFEITEIKEFQALQPNNPYTNFIDLESGEQLSVNQVFIEVYMGDFHTTLQTCIAAETSTEWGRLFTIAPPLY